MHAGLDLLLRVRPGVPEELRGLTGQAFRVALERPYGWEYRLFAAALEAELEKSANLRDDHRAGIAVGPGGHISGLDGAFWMLDRGRDVARLADVVKEVGAALTMALGPPGQPGDVRGLVTAARQLGGVYRTALEIALRIQLGHYDDGFLPAVPVLARFGDDLIEKVENWPNRIVSELDAAMADPDGPPRTVRLDAVVGHDPAEFAQAMDTIVAHLRREYL